MTTKQLQAAIPAVLCGRCNRTPEDAACVERNDSGDRETWLFLCHGKRVLVTVDMLADGPPPEFWLPFGEPVRKVTPPVVFRHGKVSTEARRERRTKPHPWRVHW